MSRSRANSSRAAFHKRFAPSSLSSTINLRFARETATYTRLTKYCIDRDCRVSWVTPDCEPTVLIKSDSAAEPKP